MLNSYVVLNFQVIKEIVNSWYGNGKDKRLVILGPVALFSNFKFTTSSGKHMEDISHAHIVSLLYKPITSAKDSDDLSFGFDWNCRKRPNELTGNKNIASKRRMYE